MTKKHRRANYSNKTTKVSEPKSEVHYSDNAALIYNSGKICYDKGDYRKSILFLKRASKIYKNILGVDHLDNADTLNLLGKAYFNVDDYNKSIEYLQKALKIYEEKLGADNIDTSVLNYLGDACGHIGGSC